MTVHDMQPLSTPAGGRRLNERLENLTYLYFKLLCTIRIATIKFLPLLPA